MFTDLEIQCDASLDGKTMVSSIKTASQIVEMLGDSDYVIQTSGVVIDDIVRLSPVLYHELEEYLQQTMQFLDNHDLDDNYELN